MGRQFLVSSGETISKDDEDPCKIKIELNIHVTKGPYVCSIGLVHYNILLGFQLDFIRG